jgi:hypothetical protein
VDVQIMWAIKQKDNRIDYELGDTETRPCVHSLFPQMGYAPCWYLSRHKNQTITVGSIPRPSADVPQTLNSAGAVGQTPWSARHALVPLFWRTRDSRHGKRPARGPAADQGVRPTALPAI